LYLVNDYQAIVIGTIKIYRRTFLSRLSTTISVKISAYNW